MNQFHKKMVRQTVRENPLKAWRPIKKRTKPDKKEIVVSSPESESDDDDLEDVDLTGAHEQESSIAPNEGEESDAFEDLEDVDLDAAFGNSNPAEKETLTFTIHAKTEIPEKKGKKINTISKEERHSRKLIHKLYIESMVIHGALRNRWCNDPAVTAALRDLLPRLTMKLLNEKWTEGKESVLARRFILGLLKAQEIYSKKFKVTCQGLVRKDWGDMLVEQNYIEHNVNLAKFRRLVNTLQGSRDIGAQGFVALLRSCGVHCRLVFSLQPPDFRSILPAQSTVEKNEKAKKEKASKPRSEFDPVFIPNAKQEVLAGVRTQTSPLEPLRRKYKFPMSRYPIFWVEAWNKFSRKWITIDPIVFECVEVMPMRKKCLFEPPGNEKTHQSQYIIAFDNYGRVKDVTRRYTLSYNANVIKKRIDALSDEDEHWYQMVLRSASTSSKKSRQAEIFELKEFYDRDVTEGIPKAKKGFKDHPLYALESEIRQDEVIYPKDDTSKCGTFKSLNKSTIVPIYKRSHVYRIRTAKAWYMRGRVLKMGVLPLKTKKANSAIPGETGEDDDGEVRLYAEFQTQLFIPTPIIDGKITKNAYGNVEIFTATMMPQNGYLVKLTEKVSMKLLERAARDVLRIDYAKAIVAFDFGKKGMTTPREGGILIDIQFKEAMSLVIDGLVEIEEEEKRKGVELNALRCWKFFLAKLRIMRRLDREHGKISQVVQPKEDIPDESNDEEGYYSVASEGEGSSGEDNYVPRKRRKFATESMLVLDTDEGGFIPDEGGFVPDEQEKLDDFGSGGHLHPEDEFFLDNEGGFYTRSATDNNEESGGFFPDVNDDYELDASNQENGITLGTNNYDNEPGGFLATDGNDSDTLLSKFTGQDQDGGFFLETERDGSSEHQFIGEPEPEMDEDNVKASYADTTETSNVNADQIGESLQISQAGDNSEADKLIMLPVIDETTNKENNNLEHTDVISIASSDAESTSPIPEKKSKVVLDILPISDSNEDAQEWSMQSLQQETETIDSNKKKEATEKTESLSTQEDYPIESTYADESAYLNLQQADEEMFDFDYSDSE